MNFGTSVYLIERSLRTLDRTFVHPIETLIKGLIDAGEDARKFIFTVAGPLGDLGRARALNTGIVRAAGSSPATVENLRESAKTLAFNSALSGRLTFANSPEQAVGEVSRLEFLTRRLSVIDPAQGETGATQAIRDLVEGGGGTQAMAALRRRFGVSARTLAREVASQFGGDFERALSEVEANPTTALTALEKYVDHFIGPEAGDRMGRLVTVRMLKIREAIGAGLSDVAESGVFDKVVDKPEGVQKALLDHLAGPQWEAQAHRISDSLGHVLDNVGGMITSFLAKVTGTTGGADSVGGVVELAAKAIDKLARASDVLPDLGTNIGTFVHELGNVVSKAVDQVQRLTEAIENFSILQNLYDGGRGDTGTLQREVTIQMLSEYGIRGARIGKEEHHQTAYHPRLGGRDVVSYDDVLDLRGVQDPNQLFLANDLYQRVRGLEPRQLVSRARLRDTLGDDLLGRLEAVKGRTGLRGAGDEVPPDPPSDVPDLVRQLIRAEYQGPGYAALLKSIGSATTFEGPSDQTAIAKLVQRGDAGFSMNFGPSGNLVTLSNVFGKLREQFAEATSQLDKALEWGRAVENPSTLLQVNLKTLTGVRDALPARQSAAEAVVRGDFLEMARQYGDALAAAAKDLPPFAAEELRKRTAMGATDLGDRIAKALAHAGAPITDAFKEIGRGALPLWKQAQRLAEQLDAGLQNIQASSHYGRLSVGMLPSQVIGAVANRPSQRAANLAALRYLEGPAREQEAGMVYRPRAQYQKDPNPQNFEALAGATQKLAEFEATARDLRRELGDAGEAMIEFGDQLDQLFVSTVGDAIYALMTNFNDLEKVGVDAVQGIQKEFSQTAGKVLVNALFNALGGGMSDLLGGLFGAGKSAVEMTAATTMVSAASIMMAAATTMATAAGTSVTTATTKAATAGGGFSFFGMLGSVDKGAAGLLGGVAHGAGSLLGGIGSLFGFAQGGVATRPTVALFGEAGAEAFVPMRNGRIPIERTGSGMYAAVLPSGKRIPASVTHTFADGGWIGPVASGAGGAGGHGGVTIYNVANYEEAVARGYRGLRGQILNDVAQGRRRGEGGEQEAVSINCGEARRVFPRCRHRTFQEGI